MPKGWRRGCIPFIFLMAPALAQSQDSATTRGVEMFNQCATITKDAERLQCFDRVTRQMRDTPELRGTASTGPARSRSATSATQQRADFGLDAVRQREQRLRGPRKLDRVQVKVAAAKEFIPGTWAILLEDGAIWEMTEGAPEFLPPTHGQTVRIKRGMLGGYLLYAGPQAGVRVKRVS